MKFEGMNEIQRKLHNAAIVVDAEGDEYGYAKIMLNAIDEIEGLRDALSELMPFVLEEYYPNCATDSYRQAIEKAKAAIHYA